MPNSCSWDQLAIEPNRKQVLASPGNANSCSYALLLLVSTQECKEDRAMFVWLMDHHSTEICLKCIIQKYDLQRALQCCRCSEQKFLYFFVVTQDLGCGWGSLALRLCEHYPNCTVTTVSNSNSQRKWIESEAVKKGFSSRMRCITSDANVFNTSLRFDRIISIEMFEVRIMGWLPIIYIEPENDIPFHFSLRWLWTPCTEFLKIFQNLGLVMLNKIW